MNEVLINVKGLEIEDLFKDKDLVSVEELVSKLVDMQYDIEELKSQIDRLEHPDDGSDELYEAWKDYYS